MTATIQAKVNTRLLAKASRLFTGTLGGRIIEILQNARRAGAKNVQITNADGLVTVRDDGQGIEDFASLLDLGGSNWASNSKKRQAKLEAAEDPAGVGLFCLSPRAVTIRSAGKIVTIEAEGWTGAEVSVEKDYRILAGTTGIAASAGAELSFADEPWEFDTVSPLAAFTGLTVTVGGEACPKERFITGRGAHHPELGCRISVVRERNLGPWHRRAGLDRDYGDNLLVNFHGQVIAMAYRPVSEELVYLVDMTDQPTGLRLMLPARTRLVENEALAQLKAALELEGFKYVQRQDHHALPYTEYLRAQELGIELKEAKPTYRAGLLSNDMGPEPVEVIMPKGHPLSQCYRLDEQADGEDCDEANVHLLAALGTFQKPFVPVEIRKEYDGYTWTKLPTVGKVEIKAGKVLQESCVGGGQLICVDDLTITAQASDGRVYSSSVCMAIKPPAEGQESWMADYQVYVTPEAQTQLNAADIWFHFGGFSDDSDSYDTQESQFSEEMEGFWMRLSGPQEPLRCKLMDCLWDLPDGWTSVTIVPDGRVTIRQKDGKDTTLLPPRSGKEGP